MIQHDIYDDENEEAPSNIYKASILEENKNEIIDNKNEIIIQSNTNQDENDSEKTTSYLSSFLNLFRSSKKDSKSLNINEEKENKYEKILNKDNNEKKRNKLH